MARRKENPNQLKLFMTPKEIMSEYKPNEADAERRWDYKDAGEDGRLETDEELWSRKADEASWSGLMDDIRERGVHIPVSLDFANKRVRGGHHRIAAMNHINPHQFIPVNYADDVAKAYDDEDMYIKHATKANLEHHYWERR